MGVDGSDDERPAYQRLAEALRTDIRDGRLKSGDQVPSVRQLAQAHGVAAMTAQNALRVLHDEGLIFTSPGRGTFVRTELPRESEDPVTDLTRRIEALEGEVRELKQQRGELTADQK